MLSCGNDALSYPDGIFSLVEKMGADKFEVMSLKKKCRVKQYEIFLLMMFLANTYVHTQSFRYQIDIMQNINK